MNAHDSGTAAWVGCRWHDTEMAVPIGGSHAELPWVTGTAARSGVAARNRDREANGGGDCERNGGGDGDGERPRARGRLGHGR